MKKAGKKVEGTRRLKKKSELSVSSNIFRNDRLCENAKECMTTVADLTRLKLQEEERNQISKLIDKVNSDDDFRRCLSDLTYSMQSWTKCEAIGVRLREGLEFPYYETRGFSSAFVNAERHLCQYSHDGSERKDESGNPTFSCMCGNVLRRRIDTSKEYFTQKGSFWTNSTTELMSSNTDEGKQVLSRNPCNSEGYESVILIPLKSGEDVFGLIQLNDHRRNLFTKELIDHLESITESIALALSRRITMQELSDTKESLSLFMKHSPISAFIKDVSPGESRVLMASESFIDMIGIPGSQMIGKKMDELFPAEFAAKITADDWEVTSSGKILHIDEHLNNRNYTTIKFPILLNGKSLLAGYSIDITESKQAESALKESEYKYRELVENSPDAIAIYSDGKIVFVNSECLNLMAASTKEELLGKPVIEFVHPDFREMVATRMREAAFEGKVLPLNEEKFIRLNGSEVEVNVKAMPIRFDGKSAVQLIVRDITERKQNEKAIKESEQRLRSLVRILQFDASIKSILDFTLEEATNLTGSELGYIYFYDEEKKQFNLQSSLNDVTKGYSIIDKQSPYSLSIPGIWGETVRQRKPIVVNDYKAHHPSKNSYPKDQAYLYRFLTIPVIAGNEIVAVTGVGNKSTDYTETDIMHLTLLTEITWKTIQKKNIEEQLKSQNSELKKLSSNKDRLMSILAHDLRNPFNVLLGLSELLSSNIKTYDLDKIEKQASIINISAHRIYNLLEEILMWSKSQSGTINFEPRNLILIDVYNKILEILKPIADSKKLIISQNISHELCVFADQEMLKIILRNLISNAIKFSHIGGFIYIDVQLTKGELIISVADNGVGINPEFIEHLFDGSDIHSTDGTSHEKGTGLGLLLCKEFIDKHSGRIWVESKPGKGSVFYFSIPKKK